MNAETEEIQRPRCPKCGRVQAVSVVKGHFICPECKTEFIIGAGFVTVLTAKKKGAMVESKT